ncbi:unnamed protein product [Discula destructiva]
MATEPVFYFPLEMPIANDRVKLVAFDAELHSTAFVGQSSPHPELFHHMPGGYFESVEELRSLILEPGSILSNSNPGGYLFAIIDLTREPSAEDDGGQLAGMIAYINTSEVNRSTEIGAVVVLPKFQRTHVTTNAVGLLMQRAYASPKNGGLGLARTEWKCNAANLASVKVAERLGYQKVGMIPYHMNFPLGKRTGKVGNGKPLPPGSHPDDLWRDTLYYSLSWDLWDAEARSMVEKAMTR